MFVEVPETVHELAIVLIPGCSVVSTISRIFLKTSSGKCMIMKLLNNKMCSETVYIKLNNTTKMKPEKQKNIVTVIIEKEYHRNEQFMAAGDEEEDDEEDNGRR